MAGAAVATSVILQKKKIKTELKFYNGDLSSFIGVRGKVCTLLFTKLGYIYACFWCVLTINKALKDDS